MMIFVIWLLSWLGMTNCLIIKFTPYELSRRYHKSTIEGIFGSISVEPKVLNTLSQILLVPFNGYRTLYFGITESDERAHDLAFVANDSTFDTTILHEEKLFANLKVFEIFVERDRPHQGDLSRVMKENETIPDCPGFVEYMIKHQARKQEFTWWFRQHLRYVSKDQAIEVYKLLVETNRLSPQIMSVFSSFDELWRLIIADYLKNGKDSRDKIVRAVLVSVAPAYFKDLAKFKRPLIKYLWDDLVGDENNRELAEFILPKSIYTVEFYSFFESLGPLNDDDYVYPSVLATLCLKNYGEFFPEEWTPQAERIIQSGFVDRIDPWVMRPLIFLYSHHAQISFSTDILLSHWPMKVLPLSEKLRLWSQHDILSIGRCKLILSNVQERLAEFVQYGTMPLNYRVKLKDLDHTDGNDDSDDDDDTIFFIDEVLRTSSFPEQKALSLPDENDSLGREKYADHILYSIASWICALVEGKKLDYSGLFIGLDSNRSWKEFQNQFARRFRPGFPNEIEQILTSFKFSTYFTPREMRLLVDSSYSEHQTEEDLVRCDRYSIS